MSNLFDRRDWRYMNGQRYSADQVLREHGVKRPPVPVRRISRQLGVELLFVSGAEWDGAVESDKDTGEATIYVNADQSETRQRFTIAHELGHLLRHRPGVAYRDIWSSRGSSVKEIEANQFAANLLMPAWMISAYAPARSISDLASMFKVSHDAMSIRLKVLGYRLK